MMVVPDARHHYYVFEVWTMFDSVSWWGGGGETKRGEEERTRLPINNLIVHKRAPLFAKKAEQSSGTIEGDKEEQSIEALHGDLELMLGSVVSQR